MEASASVEMASAEPIEDTFWFLRAEEEPCTDCGCTSYVEDTRHGDLICNECGLVKDMKLVDPAAEYRTFQDDDGESESKKRVDGTSNPFLRYNFIGTSPKIQDGTEFLREAERDMRNALDIMFQDLRDKGVEDLLQREFHRQCLQKKAKVAQDKQEKEQGGRKVGVHLGVIKTENNKKKRKQKMEARERFSRKKPFVVACIWWALKERRINRWTHEDISRLIEGKEVSHQSLVRCLKDMGVWQK